MSVVMPASDAVLASTGRVAIAGERYAQLLDIEGAAADLVRKLDEHERRGWKRIAVGALRPLRAVLKPRGEVGGDVRLEWAVRYPAGVIAAAKNSEQVNRKLAERNDGQLVQREIRTGPWTDAEPTGDAR